MGIAELLSVVAAALLFLTLGIAATTDVISRKVYNWLTWPAIALGLGLGYAIGGVGSSPWEAHSLVSHLAGLGLGFGLMMIGWWSRAVGGGEVKLAGAVGALGGFPFMIPALFWSSVVGAIIAIWVLVWRGQLVRGLRQAVRYAISVKAELPAAGDPAAVKIPYALAMAFGTLLAWSLEQGAL
jgi:prepilin peptidase CpaA